MIPGVFTKFVIMRAVTHEHALPRKECLRNCGLNRVPWLQNQISLRKNFAADQLTQRTERTRKRDIRDLHVMSWRPCWLTKDCSLAPIVLAPTWPRCLCILNLQWLLGSQQLFQMKCETSNTLQRGAEYFGSFPVESRNGSTVFEESEEQSTTFVTIRRRQRTLPRRWRQKA